MLVRDEVDRQLPARRAPDGEAERAVARRQHEERGREHGPDPLLRVAEEAPRPLPRLDARGGQLAELVGERLEPVGHQVEEHAALQAERRPVEIVVRDEPPVLLAATASEQHLEDRWMLGARQPLQLPEGRKRDTRLTP